MSDIYDSGLAAALASAADQASYNATLIAAMTAPITEVIVSAANADLATRPVSGIASGTGSPLPLVITYGGDQSIIAPGVPARVEYRSAGVRKFGAAYAFANSVQATPPGQESRPVQAITAPAALPAPSSGALTADKLTYLGAFKLPLTSDFDFSHSQPAYDAATNTLFLSGIKVSSGQVKAGAVSIPALSTASSFASLNTASVAQAFVDVTEGKTQDIDSTATVNANGVAIRGMHVVGSDLLIALDSYYDAGGTQTHAVFKRPKNLSTTGAVIGPVKIGTRNPHSAQGAMITVPAAIQAANGIKPVVITQGISNIISNQSYGPPLNAFDPADITTAGATITAQELMHYPKIGGTSANELPRLIDASFAAMTDPSASQNNWFNWTTKNGGVLWDGGYTEIGFIALHGTGPFWYGDAQSSNPAAPPGDPGGYDGANTARAPHAWPYVLRVLRFAVADVLAVKAGTKNAWDVVPTGYFDLTTPFDDPLHYCRAACTYDEAGKRLFVVREDMHIEGYQHNALVTVYGVA